MASNKTGPSSGPGSISMLRRIRTKVDVQTPLQKMQWGTTPIPGPTVTDEEKKELLKSGYYMTQWKQARKK